MFIGGIVGGLYGGVSAATNSLRETGEVDLLRTLNGASIGLVGGAVAGLLAPLSPGLTLGAGAILGGATGVGIELLDQSSNDCLRPLLVAGGIGAAAGTAGAAAGLAALTGVAATQTALAASTILGGFVGGSGGLAADLFINQSQPVAQ